MAHWQLPSSSSASLNGRYDEPHIVIEGNVLSRDEAMVLRVALTDFHREMSKPGALGKDKTGEAIRKKYRAGAEAIFNKMGY